MYVKLKAFTNHRNIINILKYKLLYKWLFACVKKVPGLK